MESIRPVFGSHEMYRVTVNCVEQVWWVGSRYKLQRVLGSGSCGCVCLAVDNTTGLEVAIKRISDVLENTHFALRVLREVALLRRLHHKNIISLIDVFVPSSKGPLKNLYIVFEYGGPDLNNAPLPHNFCEEHIKKVMKQLLEALCYLHHSHVIHRDIKPANVLINSDMQIKLADFGLARVILPGQDAAVAEENVNCKEKEAPQHRPSRCYSAHVVTRWYRAPEVILCNGLYSSAIDIWSTGCILAELLAAITPQDDEIKTLFPGRTCFPLSPAAQTAGISKEEKEDQLDVILSVIGTPSAEAIHAMQCDQQTKNFLLKIPEHPPVPLCDRFPVASPECLDLLRQMITFDPKQRVTAEHALMHRWFAKTQTEVEIETKAEVERKKETPHCVDLMLQLDLESSIEVSHTTQSLERLLRREIGIDTISDAASASGTQLLSTKESSDKQVEAESNSEGAAALGYMRVFSDGNIAESLADLDDFKKKRKTAENPSESGMLMDYLTNDCDSKIPVDSHTGITPGFLRMSTQVIGSNEGRNIPKLMDPKRRRCE